MIEVQRGCAALGLEVEPGCPDSSAVLRPDQPAGLSSRGRGGTCWGLADEAGTPRALLGFLPLRLSALGRQDALSPYPIGCFHELVPPRILKTPEEIRVGANLEMLTLECGLSRELGLQCYGEIGTLGGRV